MPRASEPPPATPGPEPGPAQGPRAHSAAHFDLAGFLAKTASVRELVAALQGGRRAVASGAVGSSSAFIAAAVARETTRTAIFVCAHGDDADEALDELTSAGIDAVRLPALEALPGESAVSVELFAERLGVVRRLLDASRQPTVLIAPIAALMQPVPAPATLGGYARTITRGQTVDLAELVRWLDGAGYRRADAIEDPGDFAVRGGIVDIFPPGGAVRAGSASAGAAPVRLDFFGDQIDRITEIDLDTMGSDRAIDEVELVCADAQAAAGAAPGAASAANVSVLELVSRGAVVLLSETREIVEQGRGYYERLTEAGSIFGPPAVLKLLGERFHALAELNQFSLGAASADVRIELPISPVPPLGSGERGGDAGEAVKELSALTGPPEHAIAVVPCRNRGETDRLTELLREHGGERSHAVSASESYVHRGFVWREPDREPLALVPYHELVHRYGVRRGAARLRTGGGRAMDTFLELQVGDYVVHTEHGVAIFSGLTLEKPRELKRESSLLVSEKAQDPEEYLVLEFAAKSRLFVPASKVDQVQKYIGGFSGKPPLSALGGQRWKNQKAKVAESVKDLAAELLRVRAAREHLPGIRYPGDTAWQNEFEAQFPYEETEDQLAALTAIKRDMQHERPMDRLICGDVGFGKTELAIRAAFKACEFGKQVAVLVPTTVLCEQHERTFRNRFSGFPFRVASVSRFKSDAEVRETLEALKAGQIDLIIGTHRLLSEDVRFSDLGLVIVDEEQRFGVEHKERLLRLRLQVDVLTLSATPIPRTLHMAMLGLRDISSLATAPLDRRAIVTEVIPYNERRIEQAISRELAREGQVFFVHNRVHNIKSVADDIQRMAPDARIVIGHGQMPGRELEDVMLRFMRGDADILVSTTIIESGIDIPTANTMIINDADRFGLAELHQLRGRVGRYKHRAYCYLLLPPSRNVTEIGLKRLKAIEQYSMLGAGFKIAMRDLEIRGAGNLLGAEQSGHIAAVGYEMYCQLLEESVRELSHAKPPPKASATSVELGISGVIPRAYIPSDTRRLEAYRRIALATSVDVVEQVRQDLTSAYGKPPKSVERMLVLAELRVAAAALGVKTITWRGQDVVFVTDAAKSLTDRLAGIAGNVTALPGKTKDDPAEVYYRPPPNYTRGDPPSLIAVLRKRLGASAAPNAAVTPAAPAPR